MADAKKDDPTYLSNPKHIIKPSAHQLPVEVRRGEGPSYC